MTRTPTRTESVIDSIWLLLLIVASSIWCIKAAHSLSATFDEPVYLQCGLDHWRMGSYKGLMRLGTMPLATDVQTLPLYLWEKCHGVTLDVNRDIGRILIWARWGTLIFWWTLLIYVFRVARSLEGSWAGRIASTLVACEPCLLGHAALATTDIAVTACLLAFTYEYQAGREKDWKRRVAIPSLLYGLAILAKASALVFAPVAMVVLEFQRLHHTEDFTRTTADQWLRRINYYTDGLWEFRRHFFGIIWLGLLFTFVYCGSDWTTESTFITWAQALKPGFPHDIMLWISGHLRIFTNAGEGLAQQIKHNMRGHASYIFGQEHRRAVWYYFPVALTIKCSLAFLFLPVAIAIVRGRALLNWPCLIALVLTVYSVTYRVQLGIRFMFPLVALAGAGYGVAIVRAIRETKCSWKQVALGSYVTFGSLYTATASVLVHPEGICYTNELWGGTRGGYRWLSDSNYDWGQGLKELIDWRNVHGVGVVEVWYFGSDPRSNVPPLQRVWIEDQTFLQGRPMQEVVRGKCVAVSTTLLYGPYLTNSAPGKEAVAFFKNHKPTDRTTTFFIYDFRE